jgi:hypothetical protein
MSTNDEVGSGFKIRLEYVLDEVCRDLPGGGSHELRKCVAERLAEATQAGERSLERLVLIAREALVAAGTPGSEQQA